MSDMYLVLRRRLETVATEWVTIESDVLLAAMKRKGLSYESLARQIPVSAKTAERWIKRSRVPLWHVDKVADILGLEIERPTFDPPQVTLDAAPAPRLEELIGRLIALLEEEIASRPPPRARAGAASERPG